MTGKVDKGDIVGLAERHGCFEIDRAKDLTFLLDHEFQNMDRQKFVVIVGHTPGATIWSAVWAHFLLFPVVGLLPYDTAFHANLLKSFMDGKGNFKDVRRYMKNHIHSFLDQRGYRWCVEGGGHLVKRGDFVVAAEDSGDFGPFFRLRVQHLLRSFATRTGKRALVMGGTDGGNIIYPLRDFHL